MDMNRYASNQRGGACQPSAAVSANAKLLRQSDALQRERAWFQRQRPGHLMENCPGAGRAAQPRGNEVRGSDGRGKRDGESRRLTSEAGAAVASQEPTTVLNSYAPAWTSDALGCMSWNLYTL